MFPAQENALLDRGDRESFSRKNRKMKPERMIPTWAVVGGGWLVVWLALAVWGRGPLWPPELPAQPVGGDLAMMLGYAQSWLATGDPYAALNPYPPLAAVLFAPLTKLPFAAALAVMTALTLFVFVVTTAWLPRLVWPRAERKAVWLVALVGLFSYGLFFELRWGQFNVVALGCAAWGIFCFHRACGPAMRLVGYALFCVGVQLKLYPALLVFLFTKDARAWGVNLWRWAALGAVNAALLFALGGAVAQAFGHSVQAQAAAPYVWVGNHSLQSWAAGVGQPAVVPWLFAGYALCLGWGLARAWWQPTAIPVANAALLGVLGMLLLPGVSHDYKLSLLPMGFAGVVAAHGAGLVWRRENLGRLLTLAGVSVMVAWTLFPPAAKPAALQNNAPALLAGCILFAWGGGGVSRKDGGK